MKVHNLARHAYCHRGGSSHSNSRFKPTSDRSWLDPMDLLTPRKLAVADLYDPNIKHYYFRRSDIEDILPHVARVFDQAARFLYGGSGVLVSDEGHIFTNGHVMHEMLGWNKLTVKNFDYDPLSLKNGLVLEGLQQRAKIKLGESEWIDINGSELCFIGGYNEKSELHPDTEAPFLPDVVLLRVPALAGIEPVQFADDMPNVGNELVAAIGQPEIMQPDSDNVLIEPEQKRTELFASLGNVLSYDEHRDHDDDFMVDTEIRSGISGGPVINERGELIGITYRKGDIDSTINNGFEDGFIIHRDRLLEILRQCGVKSFL